ncbi:hypothetical protein J6590_020835 [Homalodisca vitripennis]|nr:hypothetical protein J6590_020835 [Homalodisca vitripennis]
MMACRVSDCSASLSRCLRNAYGLTRRCYWRESDREKGRRRVRENERRELNPIMVNKYSIKKIKKAIPENSQLYTDFFNEDVMMLNANFANAPKKSI